jgi:hypothetical protein
MPPVRIFKVDRGKRRIPKSPISPFAQWFVERVLRRGKDEREALSHTPAGVEEG